MLENFTNARISISTINSAIKIPATTGCYNGKKHWHIVCFYVSGVKINLSKGDFMYKKVCLAITLILSSHLSADASYINSSSDTALNGSAIIDFSSQTIGSYNSLNISGVTFSGNGPVSIESTYAGGYNSTGLYLQNNFGNTLTLNFLFSNPTSAFGFNFGASDSGDPSPWTLTAYGTGNTLLESYTLPDTWSSNSGDFFGVARNGIVRAELSTQGYDYILLDNFRYNSGDTNPVPEPGTMALLGLGMTGLAIYGKRRKNSKT